ncbi:hypothetical protein Ef18B226LT_19890 [Escherichia fergusonii]|nr:hypothetical protein EsCd1HHP024_01535 [Escherichia sp. HH091_1A]BED95908.1 hypothetical protein Ef30038_23320 [Escherichia fergusonii]BES13410.1 hypothetical protein Ef18B226LT_19890 [Escherichia fergusonii]
MLWAREDKTGRLPVPKVALTVPASVDGKAALINSLTVQGEKTRGTATLQKEKTQLNYQLLTVLIDIPHLAGSR